METYGGTVRKKSLFFILARRLGRCVRCALPWVIVTAAAEMASRRLNINGFFFKKPGDVVERCRAGGRRRRAEAQDPGFRAERASRDAASSPSDRHTSATKSARTSSPPASSDKENDEDEDEVVVRIPSADDRDPVRREALARALGAASSDETKRADVQRRFRFLDPAFVRDDRGRRPSHPEYDERTCSIPAELKLSASQRQYWEIKSKYRDVGLFFKVGNL